MYMILYDGVNHDPTVYSSIPSSRLSSWKKTEFYFWGIFWVYFHVHVIQAGKTEFNKNNNILFSYYFKDPLTHNLLNKDWARARLSNSFYKLDEKLCEEGNIKNHNEYLQHPKSSKVQVVRTIEHGWGTQMQNRWGHKHFKRTRRYSK